MHYGKENAKVKASAMQSKINRQREDINQEANKKMLP